jgi:hypothetical protein
MQKRASKKLYPDLEKQLRRIIQEYQIQPMHQYVKSIRDAKRFHESMEKSHLPGFQTQLLQHLQRPPIDITLTLKPESEKFDVRFRKGSTKGNVQVKYSIHDLAQNFPCSKYCSGVLPIQINSWQDSAS